MKNALLIVDLQNDFLPGGALSVPNGDDIIPIVNKLTEQPFDTIVASRDCHPANHASFASLYPNRNPGDTVLIQGYEQILWPIHCVENTHGSALVDGLKKDRIDREFLKGVDRTHDSYSAFFDNQHQRGTGLHEYLQERGISTLYVVGLATDYCVRYTVEDGCMLGYQVRVVTDGCRGINLAEDDSEKAFELMERLGAQLMTSEEVSLQ